MELDECDLFFDLLDGYFMQLEKHSGITSFTQYYKSIMDKAASRNLAFFEKVQHSKPYFCVIFIIYDLTGHGIFFVNYGGSLAIA